MSDSAFGTELAFLVEEYGLNYQFQLLSGCWGGNWRLDAHSFYNETGCFTVAVLEQRQEIYFFYAPHPGVSFETLCRKEIRVISEADFPGTRAWKEYRSIFPSKPFFSLSPKRLARAYAELIRRHVEETGDLYGVTVRQRY